jgi:hypothetical protein
MNELNSAYVSIGRIKRNKLKIKIIKKVAYNKSIQQTWNNALLFSIPASVAPLLMHLVSCKDEEGY